MFTGLVQSTGSILSVTPGAGATRISIAAPSLAPELREGDSIAVNGVCLTALAISSSQFSADLATETIDRTTLSQLALGNIVNLELPTPAGSPLGGHVVQGHVDGTANLLSLLPLHPGSPVTSDWRLRISVPPHLLPYVVPQGSITVDGISLTVAAVSGQEIEIAIIPHTYAATSLHTLAAGSSVNIETDVLARYSQQGNQNAPEKEWLTANYLLANGY